MHHTTVNAHGQQAQDIEALADDHVPATPSLVGRALIAIGLDAVKTNRALFVKKLRELSRRGKSAAAEVTQ